MQLKNFIFFIVFCLSFSITTKAQPLKLFSDDAALYPQEIKKYFDNDKTINKNYAKEIDKIIAAYENIWLLYNTSLQTQLINVSNNLLKAKVRSYPDFYNFLYAQLLFSGNNFITKNKFTTIIPDGYNNWVDYLEKLSSKKKLKDINDFIVSSNDLIEGQYINQSIAVNWIFDGDEYYFQESDGKPTFIFDQINLICFIKNDTSVISNTKGIYYPLENLWTGDGGILDFRQAGLTADSFYIKLSQYKINTHSAKYTAENVLLYNKQLFREPLQGKLEEKILIDAAPNTNFYPKFETYSNNIEIKNIFPNVDFTGRFVQAGAKLQFDGKNDYAHLYFRKNDSIIAHTRSKNFTIKNNKINAANAAVALYLDTDSIYNSTCEMRFDNEKRELTLLHTQQSLASPFVNSYHNLNMYFETLIWNIDADSLNIGTLRVFDRGGTAVFESFNYYSDNEYAIITSKTEKNPLLLLKKKADLYNTTTLLIDDVMPDFNYDKEQMKSFVLYLSSLGFVVYNQNEESFILQNKLYLYLDASVDKTDYDDIFLASTSITARNATVNMKDFSMTIYDINKVIFSRHQNVYALPKNNKIIVKRNRNLYFDGHIKGGKFDFIAKDCNFSYEEFKIRMNNVDTLKFSINVGKPDLYGNYQQYPVSTIISNLSGDLFIDHPKNKSGKRNIPEYPSFQSIKESYIYYDKPEIRKGIYKREKFYYEVYPFHIKQLNNFVTDSIKFRGILKSGIFPDIEKPLIVMPDYSLGLVYATDYEGLPVYNKGRFYDTITLSNKGLVANGCLTYNASKSTAKELIFMPDSMIALSVDIFSLEQSVENTEIPLMKGKNISEKWIPEDNILIAGNTKEPFTIYDSLTLFNGVVALKNNQLSGSGRLLFNEYTDMKSNSFYFQARKFKADSVDFGILSKDKKQYLLKTTNYSATADLNQQRTAFKANTSSSAVGFPVNQYLCFMDELEWKMNTNEIYLINTTPTPYTQKVLAQMTPRELASIELPGSDFVSQHNKQNGLSFRSNKAKYNIYNNILDVENVWLIRCADVVIMPKNGNIKVLPNADMNKLEDAKIALNSTTFQHLLEHAAVKINGQKNYTADGDYKYINAIADTFNIHFKNVTPNKTGISTGTAVVDDSSAFALSPEFGFTGKINLSANLSFLKFDGYTKINHRCNENDNDNRSWIKFSDEIIPDSVVIPIESPIKNNENRKLGAGLYISKNNEIYSSFLEPLESGLLPIIETNGNLLWDHLYKSYIIENKNDNGTSINITLNTENCVLKAYGWQNFQCPLEEVKTEAFGSISYRYDDQTILSDIVFNLNFYFDNKLLEDIAHTINKEIDKGINLSTSQFEDFIYEKCAAKKAEQLLKDIEYYGTLRKIPDELANTISFYDLKLKWDEVSKTFISFGELGIGNIGTIQVNKYVKGVVQLMRHRRGNTLNLYIEIDKNHWYFFSYTNGLMQAISSDENFNKTIEETKPSKRKGTGQNYEYDLSTLRKVKSFINSLENSDDFDPKPPIQNNNIKPDNDEDDETEE